MEILVLAISAVIFYPLWKKCQRDTAILRDLINNMVTLSAKAADELLKKAAAKRLYVEELRKKL